MVKTSYEALTELKATGLSYRDMDPLHMAQEVGFNKSKQELIELLGYVDPADYVSGFRYAARAFSNLANLHAENNQYLDATEFKVYELAGLELALMMVGKNTEWNGKEAFFLNRDLGQSYAKLARWFYQRLDRKNDMEILLSYFRLNNSFKMACDDERIEFNAKTFEFMTNMMNKKCLGIFTKRRNWQDKDWCNSLCDKLFRPATELCEIAAIRIEATQEKAPYVAAQYLREELKDFNVSDLMEAIWMVNHRLVPVPENIELSSRTGAVDTKQADARKVEYDVKHLGGCTIWTKKSQV